MKHISTRKMRARRRFAGALVALSALSCHEDKRLSPYQGESKSSTLDSVPVVHLDLKGGAVFVRKVTQQASITEITPGVPLSNVGGVAADSAGNIYILDELNYEVGIFDRHGKYEKAFSRKGHGPGELTEPRSLALLHDTLYVRDDVLELFHGNGEFIISKRPANFDIRKARRTWSIPGGVALSSTVFAVMSGSLAPDTILIRTFEVGDDSVSGVLVRATRDEMNYGGVYGLPPLEVAEAIDISNTGNIYHSRGNTFDIAVHGKDGHLNKVIIGDVQRVATTSQDLEDDYQTRVRQVQSSPHVSLIVTAKHLRELFFKAKHPNWRPVIGSLIVGDDESLLIERHDLSARPYETDGAAPRKWLLLGPTLQSKGFIELPSTFEPMILRACTVIGLKRGENEEPTVVSYSISPHALGSDLDCASHSHNSSE